MGLAVRLAAPALRVVPGAEAGTDVRIRNTGHLVDRADLSVLGEAAGWARVEPALVNLLPGQEETVRVTFAPPRAHDVAAGERPFAVRAASREDPGGSAVEEGVLTVSEFDLVVAEMVPRTSRAPRAGRHQLTVDNLSNHPLTLHLTPSDPDLELEFRLDATRFVAQPGTATFVRVRARPTTRFLRGIDRQLPFEVAVAVPGSPPVVAPGVVRQHAILPAWLFRLALFAALLVSLWVVVLKPRLDAKVRDVAEAEAVKATAPLTPKVNQLVKQDNAAAAPAVATSAPAGPTATPTPTPTPTPTASPRPKPRPGPKPAPAPVPFPLSPGPSPAPAPAPAPAPLPSRQVNFYKTGWVKQGETAELGPVMPSRDETVVRLTRIVIDNPYGDFGTVFINGIRAGEKETAVDFEGRRVELVVDQPAYFDRASPVKARVRCAQVSGSNPGPPGVATEVRYCLVYVLFNGYTQEPAPKPWPTQTPAPQTPAPQSPAPPVSSRQPATVSRWADF